MNDLRTLAARVATRMGSDEIHALLTELIDRLEALERRHDFTAGLEPLPPLADLANDLLRNIARVPNEVPAFPSRWSFEPDERKVG